MPIILYELMQDASCFSIGSGRISSKFSAFTYSLPTLAIIFSTILKVAGQ